MTNPAAMPPNGSTPPTSAPAPTGSPAPAKGLSTGAKVAIVLVVVLLLVVAALAIGVVPGISLTGSSGSTGGPSTSSSSTALGDAKTVAKSYDSGALVLAVGVDSTYSFSFGEVTGNASCSVSHGVSANFTVPAWTGSYSTGDASLWVFFYYNSTTPSESLVAVVGSTTYFLGIETGAKCVGSIDLPAIPSTAISSTAAASAVGTDAISFTTAHPSANAVYALLGNTTIGAEWYIGFTNCSYNPATHTAGGGKKGDLFEAEVNGVSAAVLDSGDLFGDANCTALASDISTGGTGTTSYGLLMEEEEALGSASSWEEFLTLDPTAGLTTSMFAFKLTNVGGTAQIPATVPSGCAYGVSFSASVCGAGTGWYAVVLSFSDTVLATFGNSTGVWGNLGPDTASGLVLTDSMNLVIVSNTSLAGIGDTLTAYATGANPVSGSTTL